MIVVDTHVWVWWINQDSRLTPAEVALLRGHEDDAIGVPAICLWEIALLTGKGRLSLATPTEEWLDAALLYPGMRLLPLTPAISVDSVGLPGDFHKDPADRLIVATARVHSSPLLTHDAAIIDYAHVLHASP